MALHFSAAARYALKALAHLAGQDAQGLVTAEAIVAACRTSGPFTGKVLHALAGAGLLRSLKGPNGGYALARPTDQITLLEVVEAVDGKIAGNVLTWNATDRALDRRLGQIMDGAAETFRRQLGGVRLLDLVNGAANIRPRGRRSK
jgi:Rrf2 family protein